MTARYDALVVGGDDAAILTAVQLARRGVDVCLVDPGARDGGAGYVVVTAELLAADGSPHCARNHRDAQVRAGRRVQRLHGADLVSLHRTCWVTRLHQRVQAYGVPRILGRVADVVRSSDGWWRLLIRRADGEVPETVEARHLVDSVGLDTALTHEPLVVIGEVRRELAGVATTALTWDLDVGCTQTGASSRVTESVPVAEHLTLRSEVVVYDKVRPMTLQERERSRSAGTEPMLLGRTGSWIMIGAARGLVNRTTGQGAELARRGAQLVAEAVQAHPLDSEAARNSFERRLTTAVRGAPGAFEPRLHGSAFRSVVHSVGDRSPHLTSLRRAVLLSTDAPAHSRRRRPEPAASSTSADLLMYEAAVDGLIGRAVSRSWPVTRVADGGRRSVLDLHRPSRFLGRCFEVLGGSGVLRLTKLGAALDLATSAGFSLLAAVPTSGEWVDEPDLGFGGSLMSADVCLAHALRFSADLEPDVLAAVSSWIIEWSSADTGREGAFELFGETFELCARLAGATATVRSYEASRLRHVGAQFGRAVARAEEAGARSGWSPLLGLDVLGFRQAGLTGRTSARAPVAAAEAVAHAHAARRWLLLLPETRARADLVHLVAGVPARLSALA